MKERITEHLRVATRNPGLAELGAKPAWPAFAEDRKGRQTEAAWSLPDGITCHYVANNPELLVLEPPNSAIEDVGGHTILLSRIHPSMHRVAITLALADAKRRNAKGKQTP